MQLAEYVKMPKEVCNSEILSQRIQRDLSDKHVKHINSYLQKEDDRLSFWKLLANKMPDIEAFFDKGEITYQRSDKGGSLLFRPRGICPFVEAITTICMKKNIAFDKAIEFFVEVDCMLDSKLWQDILWNGEMIDPGHALIRDMFVYMYDSTLLTEKRIGTIMEKISEKKHITEEDAKNLLSLS